MTSLRSNPALIRAIANIETRLTRLREERSSQPGDNTEKAQELDAEISALKRTLNQLTEVDSSAALVNVYYSALSLATRIAEHPRTIGESHAETSHRNPPLLQPARATRA
jgi:nucleoid-associated protein YejK